MVDSDVVTVVVVEEIVAVDEDIDVVDWEVVVVVT